MAEILGSEFDDTLIGGAEADRLSGLAGNDWLNGQEGDDSLDGGAGDDQLFDAAGSNTLDGGDGNDLLSAQGSGFGPPQTASLSGGTGDDLLGASLVSQAVLLGGEGQDTVGTFAVRDLGVAGEAGNDTLNAFVSGAFTTGTDGDAFAGTSTRLDGGMGDDTLQATVQSGFGQGMDAVTLVGGDGQDVLQVQDVSAGQLFSSAPGVYRAVLDGGVGDDRLVAAGVLQAELTGGGGRDRFVLTEQQWRLQQAGARLVDLAAGAQALVDPEPLRITDFQAGPDGDVLEIGGLLRAMGLDPEGANPFAPGGALVFVPLGVNLELRTTDAQNPVRLAVLLGVDLATLATVNLDPPHAPDGSPPQALALTGTEAADLLAGALGDDTLVGLGGDDQLRGQGGADSLDGGDGQDVLLGGSGLDTLIGGLGDDLLDGEAGGGLLDGGDGHDALLSASGSVLMAGGGGNDLLQAFGGGAIGASLVLDGGEGTDRFVAQTTSQARLDGGSGDDSFEVSGVRQLTLSGGTGDDVAQVFVDAFSGQLSDGRVDLLKSANLDGGDGDDRLNVTAFTSTQQGQTELALIGGAGDDLLTARDASAGVFGDPAAGISRARLDGGDGADTLDGRGVVQLTLAGGAGSDRFVLSTQQWRTLHDGPRRYVDAQNVTTEVVTPEPVRITDFQAGLGGDVLVLDDLLAGVDLQTDGSNPFAPGGDWQWIQQGADLMLRVRGLDLALLEGVAFADLQAENLQPPYAPDGNEPVGALLTGSAFNDALVGTRDRDTLDGLDGDDLLDAGGSADWLLGGAGQDTLFGGGGQDLLEGGDGDDTLDGGAGQDTLQGGAGNDQLTESLGHNRLDGGLGDDRLSVDAFGSADVQATLLGGGGVDQLTVQGLAQAMLDGGDDADQLTSLRSRAATLSGGSGNDVLVAQLDNGTSAATDGNALLLETAVLDGGAGNDELSLTSFAFGGFGSAEVTLSGGDGDDLLLSRDTLAGNFGLPTANNNGLHKALLDGGAGQDTLSAGGALDLTLSGGEGADTFVLTVQQWRTQLEGARTIGQTDGSTLTVTPGPTRIADFQAGPGGDVLDLRELLGASVFSQDGSNPFGPEGPLAVTQGEQGAELRFNGTVVALLAGVLATDLVADNVQPPHAPDGSPPPGQLLTGSEFGDTLVGGPGADTLLGLDGDDLLDGGVGPDQIDGGAGQDTLAGGRGNDSLDGGLGHDLLIDTGGRENRLDGGEGDDQLVVQGFFDPDMGATLLGGAGADALVAENLAAALLDGGSGNDALGANSNRRSELAGGAGDDVLSVNLSGFLSQSAGGRAEDAESAQLDGGDGDDRLQVGTTTSVSWGRTALQLQGGAGQDVLTVQDGFAGSSFGSGAGISHATLDGGDGDDTLRAGGVLQLTLSGGNGRDRFEVTAQQWRTQLEGQRLFQEVDGSLTPVEAGPTRITDFQAGAGGDTLDLQDLLSGMGHVDDGNNPFAPGGPLSWQADGADLLLVHTGLTLAVLLGVQLADLVADNVLPAYPPDGSPLPGALIEGTAGDDALSGGRGPDTLIGGDGQDLLNGAIGADRLDGGAGLDTLIGGVGNDSLDGGLDADQLDGDLGDDTLRGGAGDDTLVDRSGHNLLDGGEGDDRLQAGEFSRTPWTAWLQGGEGRDVVVGQFLDQARLEGGAGDDDVFAWGVRDAELSGGEGQDFVHAQIEHGNSADVNLPETARLTGDAGDDTLQLVAFTSTFQAQTHVNLDGGTGNDRLTVADLGAGSIGFPNRAAAITSALLDGGDGDDVLQAGGVLQLTLAGGTGSDTFVLTAQQWRTQLEGSRTYVDLMTGLPIATVDAGPTRITDFQAGPGGDRLDLRELLDAAGWVDEGSNPYGPQGPVQLIGTASRTGGSVVVAFQGVILAELEGVDLASLVADNLLPPAAPDGSDLPGLDLTGTDGADVLIGSAQADSLTGQGGDDLLNGDSGSDRLDGGAGNDSLDGGRGSDSLAGGDGDDELIDLFGQNALDGGTGDDLLQAAGGRRGATEWLSGGEGHDRLIATDADRATLDGGQGDDRLDSTGVRVADLLGAEGNDTLSLRVNAFDSAATDGDARLPESARLDGGTGDDSLQVEHGGPTFYGRSDFTLLGGDGQDRLLANDLDAGSGFGSFSGIASAVLDGGAGDDRLEASGVLQLTQTGGAGRDTFVYTTRQMRTLQEGSRFFDTPSGFAEFINPQAVRITDFQAGPDGDRLDLTDLLAGLGVDADSDNPFGPNGPLVFEPTGSGVALRLRVTGQALLELDALSLESLTADNLLPPHAPDGSRPAGQVLTGGAGDDSLIGNLGHDQLDGQGGQDQLVGRAGDDLLQGGDGNDTLDGGGGTDTLLGGAGDDQLTDRRGAVQMDGGEGADRLDAQAGQPGSDATVSGGAGDDQLLVEGYREARTEGGEGNDLLQLNGLRHAVVLAGDGADRVTLRLDADASIATDGNAGLDESATVDGGDGDDTVEVIAHTWFNSSSTSVDVQGGAGADALRVFDDTLGRDPFLSFAANGITHASLDGGEGDDHLLAGGVQDLRMTGGTGRDTFELSAQQWNTQQAGARFVFDPNVGFTVVEAGPTRITDFQAGASGDVLDIGDLLRAIDFPVSDLNPFDPAQPVLRLVQQGADVAVVFDPAVRNGSGIAPTTVAMLTQVDTTQLIAANFGPAYDPDGSPPNHAPVLGGDLPDQLVRSGRPFSIDLPLGLFTDADGDTLVHSATLDDGSALTDWLHLDTGTGRLSGTPAEGDAGSITIVIVASDPDGASASERFVLEVRAPRSVLGSALADRLDGSADDDRLQGLAGNDTLRGLDGDDTLDGGSGADRLSGGLGHDVYRVDQRQDRVVELADEGHDRVEASLDWTLGAAVEDLTLTGGAAARGTGNALDNRLVGNERANRLEGEAGNDTLVGGLGRDTLAGGAGNDVFVFDRLPSGRDDVDRVVDFRSGSDRLQFEASAFSGFAGQRSIEASQFRSGAGVIRALDADDRLLYDTRTGSLSYDADGAGGAAAVLVADLGAGTRLTVSDLGLG